MSTVNENIVTKGVGLKILSLMPCNMEEADEKIFVCAKHTSKEHFCIMIEPVVSDLVKIAITNFHQLMPLNELWTEFDAGKLFRFIPIHQIAGNLGQAKSLIFLFFHAFSGCDTTLSLSGKDK